MLKELVCPIEDPIARLWIIYEYNIKIQRHFKVQLHIDNTGIQIKYYENVQDVVDYINKKISMVDFRIVDNTDTVDQMKKQGANIMCLQLKKILEAAKEYQLQKLTLAITGEYILVFQKKYRSIVDQILGKLQRQVLRIEEKQVITLIACKAWKTCQEKYDCTLRIDISGVCVIEGPKQNVSKCIDMVKKTIEHYNWQFVLSSKDKTYTEYNTRRIINHLQSHRNVFWLDKDKFGERLKSCCIQKGQQFLSNIRKNHGDFLLICYRIKYKQILSEIKSIMEVEAKRHEAESSSQESKKTDEYKYFSGTVQQARQRNKYSCQIHYQNLFKSKMTKDSKVSIPTYDVPRTHKYLEFDQPQKKIPIHPLVMQGIAKFDNFKQKFSELQKNYNVKFRTEIIQGDSFLLFTTNERFKNVYYDLEFFFQDLPINSYVICSREKALLDESTSNKLIQLVKHDIKLKEAVVSPIKRVKHDMVLQIFNARPVKNIDHNKDEIQRALSKITGDKSISLYRDLSETYKVHIRKHMSQF